MQARRADFAWCLRSEEFLTSLGAKAIITVCLRRKKDFVLGRLGRGPNDTAAQTRGYR